MSTTFWRIHLSWGSRKSNVFNGLHTSRHFLCCQTSGAFCHNPKQVHWTAVTRILAYLKRMSTFGVYYRDCNHSQVLSVFAGSDYAGDSDTCKLTSGFLLVLLNGGPFAWSSRFESCVFLSTTEVGYVSICEATKDVVRGRQLLNSISCEQTQPNQDAIKLTLNQDLTYPFRHMFP